MSHFLVWLVVALSIAVCSIEAAVVKRQAPGLCDGAQLPSPQNLAEQYQNATMGKDVPPSSVSVDRMPAPVQPTHYQIRKVMSTYENYKECPTAVRTEGPAFVRAPCPAYEQLDMDYMRYPTRVVESVCACKKPVDQTMIGSPDHYDCRPVYRYIRVLRVLDNTKDCHVADDGILYYKFTLQWENISVACSPVHRVVHTISLDGTDD